MKKVCGFLLALCLMLTTWAGGAAAADASTMLNHPDALTMLENGATVVMTVGDRVALKLQQGPDWDVSITDENVISRVRNIATMIGVQGVYQATAPGSATFSAEGTFACQRANPRCMIASPIFRVTVVVQPAPTATAEFWIGQSGYSALGQSMVMAAPAFIADGRTYVPATAFKEALGATVTLAGSTVTLTSAGGGVPVSAQAESRELAVGPATVGMDVAPVVRDGILYVPLRWAAEAMGYRVGWNADSRSVTLGAQ